MQEAVKAVLEPLSYDGLEEKLNKVTFENIFEPLA